MVSSIAAICSQMKLRNSCNFCKKFCKEFKTFVSKGDVFDLAIGLIIGTAFTNVVKSLVEDIITPPFGLLLGGVDFSNLTIEIKNFVYTNKPPVVVRYGKFLEEIISLIVMAFVLFFIIKALNKLQKLAIKRRLEEENQRKTELSDEGKILLQIRDILAKKTVVVREFIL